VNTSIEASGSKPRSNTKKNRILPAKMTAGTSRVPADALCTSSNPIVQVPAKERVKISTTNVRLETTVPHKEETFQVIIDVIKNSTCYKAFTISAEVLEIFIHQFWYTIKKFSSTNSYEFLLANKRCLVDVEVFQKILDICPSVQGVNFAKVPDDETTLTFLFDLGYKGPLHKHPNMYVDHMHQPWRTLAAIINKCLSGKAARNENLRKTRINILWEINQVNTYAIRNTKLLSDIEDRNHGPSDAMHNPSQPLKHGAQPKATTDKRSNKNRNSPSSKPRTSKPVRKSSPLKQYIDTQPTEETMSTADATLSLGASESAEEQGN
ncbi:hypothetical protein Tco_0169360, partial [Tanacetum coccineum]